MDFRMLLCAEMVGRHHAPQRVGKRPLRIGQERCNTGQRLFLLGVEDMQDCADQKAVAGFFPVVAPLQRAFGIDKNIGNVLNVAHLIRPFTYLQQRIVTRRTRIGRVEQQAMRKG